MSSFSFSLSSLCSLYSAYYVTPLCLSILSLLCISRSRFLSFFYLCCRFLSQLHCLSLLVAPFLSTCSSSVALHVCWRENVTFQLPAVEKSLTLQRHLQTDGQKKDRGLVYFFPLSSDSRSVLLMITCMLLYCFHVHRCMSVFCCICVARVVVSQRVEISVSPFPRSL